MRKLALGIIVAVGLASPALAKNFAFPRNNPAATVTIPDKWKTESIDYGFSAKSPDGDVFFSIETANRKNRDKLMKDNDAWMKEQKIKVTGEPISKELDIGGLKAMMLRLPAKDENGPTLVDFYFIEAPGERYILMTLWASEKEREANAADIQAISSSIKAIN